MCQVRPIANRFYIFLGYIYLQMCVSYTAHGTAFLAHCLYGAPIACTKNVSDNRQGRIFVYDNFIYFLTSTTL